MKICNIPIGLEYPFVLISGPCVVESESLALASATRLKEITDRLGIPFIYKSSFDKANRSSHTSFRGLGTAEGLRVLDKVKCEVGVPVLSDVHEDSPLDEIAEVVDVMQTPALLCRQTNFIHNVACCGKPINLKKGQFLSPPEMMNVVAKVHAAGNKAVMVCERGFVFGYNNLVADMRSLVMMRETACPVVFDATHSVQLPGAAGRASSGQREFVPALARAAAATGISGLFMESHPAPDEALSDGANSWPLDRMEPLLTAIKHIDEEIKEGMFFVHDRERA